MPFPQSHTAGRQEIQGSNMCSQPRALPMSCLIPLSSAEQDPSSQGVCAVTRVTELPGGGPGSRIQVHGVQWDMLFYFSVHCRHPPTMLSSFRTFPLVCLLFLL